MTKTQKALVAKWKRALRSGKYRQGYGYMRMSCAGEEAYCALGVLYVVAGKKKFRTTNSRQFARITGLPGEEVHMISAYNDSLRLPFPQIADLITKLEREALTKYGRHISGCEGEFGALGLGPCHCGLSAALGVERER